MWGQHEAGALSFYDFFREVVGLKEETEKITGLLEQGKTAGWFLPHAKICWVCERHNMLNRDERGRLHNLSGPSVRYPDGWSIYAVHGLRVPADIIEKPEAITLERINGEVNVDIKRIMIERFGWPRYLKDTGATVIDGRRNDVEGTREVLVQAGNGSKVLVCACPSTARIYANEVPQEVSSCEQAQLYLSSNLSKRIVSAS